MLLFFVVASTNPIREIEVVTISGKTLGFARTIGSEAKTYDKLVYARNHEEARKFFYDDLNVLSYFSHEKVTVHSVLIDKDYIKITY